MNAIQKTIVDNYLLPVADKAYQDQIKEWENKIEAEQARKAEELKDPQYAASLGLPPNLPQHTINILKVAMAVDKYGPEKPEVDKVYRRYGLQTILIVDK